jgi:1-acyl-sn-glycerol-3-phosphate acyltransferase
MSEKQVTAKSAIGANTLALAPSRTGTERMWLSYLLTFIIRVLVGATPRWIGCRPTPALRIYYANHTSHMDTLALWCALPAQLRRKTRAVAARDYWSGAGIKSYIATRGFNALFIERTRSSSEQSGPDQYGTDQRAPGQNGSNQNGRQNGSDQDASTRNVRNQDMPDQDAPNQDRQNQSRRDRDPLAPLGEALERGESLIIFPEGTRSAQALPSPFKSGLFHLAAKYPDVELIPVYLDNLYRSMPKGSYLPVPLTCSVRFGAPLSRVDGESKDAFLLRARQAVVDLA